MGYTAHNMDFTIEHRTVQYSWKPQAVFAVNVHVRKQGKALWKTDGVEYCMS